MFQTTGKVPDPQITAGRRHRGGPTAPGSRRPEQRLPGRPSILRADGSACRRRRVVRARRSLPREHHQPSRVDAPADTSACRTRRVVRARRSLPRDTTTFAGRSSADTSARRRPRVVRARSLCRGNTTNLRGSMLPRTPLPAADAASSARGGLCRGTTTNPRGSKLPRTHLPAADAASSAGGSLCRGSENRVAGSGLRASQSQEARDPPRDPRRNHPGTHESPAPTRGPGLREQQIYLAFSRISTRRHRLVADSGRVSISSTRSPMPAISCSSCALTFEVRRMTLE